MRKLLLLRSQHSRGRLENSIILEFHREKFWHCCHVFDHIYFKLCSKITVIILITPDYHPKPDTLIWLQEKSEVLSLFFLCYAKHQRPSATWHSQCHLLTENESAHLFFLLHKSKKTLNFLRYFLLNQRDLSYPEMKHNSFPKSYWESLR